MVGGMRQAVWTTRFIGQARRNLGMSMADGGLSLAMHTIALAPTVLD
jgi:hypothetical protein